MRSVRLSIILTLAFSTVAVFACKSSPPATPPSPETLAIEQGRRTYLANCVMCHNADPTKPGGVGPEVAGASRELLEARIMRAGYPPGYEPKRQTRAMVALPHLEPKIGALAAYLGSVQPAAH
jgi:mono/diheme cytochrome c family protein